MGCIWCHVLDGINFEFMCHFAGSIHPHKGSIKVIRKKKLFLLHLPASVLTFLKSSYENMPKRSHKGENVAAHFDGNIFLLYRYGRWVTRRIAVATIAVIWILAGFVSFVPISLNLHRPDQPLMFDKDGTEYPTCALDLTPTYAVVSSCISFYVPCIVMIGIYCR